MGDPLDRLFSWLTLAFAGWSGVLAFTAGRLHSAALGVVAGIVGALAIIFLVASTAPKGP